MPSAAGLKRRALVRLATSERFERGVRALPGGEARAWRSARRYFAGTSLDDAIATVHRLAAAGLHASVDLFGGGADHDSARRAARDYEELGARLAAGTPDTTWLSVDLSHLAFDAGLLDAVAAAVPPGRRLQVGAEEPAHTDRVLDLVAGAADRGHPVEATLQANLPRSPADADRLAAAGVPVRLVKGAYVEPGALPYGAPTDDAYAALARRLHAAGRGRRPRHPRPRAARPPPPRPPRRALRAAARRPAR